MRTLIRSDILPGGAVDDLNAVISRFITDGIMILMYTDKFVCCDQQEITDAAHLLEARVFNDNAEIKIMRPSLADDFSYRVIDDTDMDNDDYIQEDHFLDRNSELSSGYDYVSTGGGKYVLPVADAEKIRIRNYISYDDQGIAQIVDFRAVRFLKEGEK